MALRSLPLVLALALVSTRAAAQDAGSADWPLVPGLMGYNALPVLPNADPVIGPRPEFELTAATQLSGIRPRDRAATPYFRLTLPFYDVAAIEMDGTPFEVFEMSPATAARLSARERSGISQGDLRFGARFLIFDEGRFPALGVRFTVKSTTGKSLHSRRFTNAPGYAIDYLAGKDLGTAGGARLRGLARLGFLAWQFGTDRQDDAIAYGATLKATLPRGTSFEVEWRGYAGWRFADRPMVLGLTGSVPVRGIDLRATVNGGLSSDAPPLEIRIGMVGRLDFLGLGRVGPEREAPPPARTAPRLAANCERDEDGEERCQPAG